MKPLHQLLILVGAISLPIASLVLYYPVHDLLGLWNTRYSASFSEDAFARIHIGMPSERVVQLLGTPFKIGRKTEYPVWALREEEVRNRYGKTNHIEIQDLIFSEPKSGSRDYELVHVTLGPDGTVIETSKWVTD